METKLSTVSGLISDAVPGAILGDLDLHRYRAILTSKAKIQGKDDVSARSVLYNVGRRGGIGTGLEDRTKNGTPIDCSFDVQDVIKSVIEASARTNNALSAGWDKADFSAIVAILAAGISHYRVFGVLTQEQLSGGQDLRYISTSSATRQIAADGHNVFVPSNADTAASPNTISALVAATTGAGGTLVSDLVGINPVDNTPRVPTSDNASLAAGCYDALCLLGANYRESNAGAVFAYAVTVGIHRVLTVHAHTDEGGIVRDLLRAADFPPPRGGIVTNLPNYTGLPDPLAGERGFTKFIDSLGLQTAGAVALADPMCVIKGKKYPTVLASPLGRYDDVPDDNDAIANLREMANSIGEFSTNYARLLERIFRLEGCAFTVSKHMIGTLTDKIGTSYAHLKHKVVAPFMWVEPTGCTRMECADMAMQAEGFGRLCSVDGKSELPAFRGAELVGDNGLVSGWHVDWRGARRHAMLHHLMCHKMDGLANLVPRQVDSTATTLLGVGAAGRRDEPLALKLVNQRGLDEYLWGRGHSSVIAPAEFINLSNSIGLAVKHGFAEAGGLSLDLAHAPATDEMDQMIEFSVTAISPVGVFTKGAPDKRLNRERLAANKALVAARLRGGISRSIDAMLPIKDGAPETGAKWEDEEADTELTIDVTKLEKQPEVQVPSDGKGEPVPASKFHGKTPGPVPNPPPKGGGAKKLQKRKTGDLPPAT